VKPLLLLVLGDLLAAASITAVGFAFHGETDLSFLPRMGTTFFPILAAWFLLAPRFGLLDARFAGRLESLWQIPLVCLLAAPFAAVVRAALLGSAASPLFTLILGSSFALGMLLWRLVFVIFRRLGFDGPRGLH
jgi:hypothetical protein